MLTPALFFCLSTRITYLSGFSQVKEDVSKMEMPRMDEFDMRRITGGHAAVEFSNREL
jgi:hypothetical protein